MMVTMNQFVNRGFEITVLFYPSVYLYCLPRAKKLRVDCTTILKWCCYISIPEERTSGGMLFITWLMFLW